MQWQIMRTAFGDGEVTLVLIGDPKQAIYAFRGADVYAYIEAARTAGAQRHADDQLAQRPGPASTPTTRCSAAPSSATRGSSTGRSAPRRERGRAPARRARRRAAARPGRAARRRRPDAAGLRAARARARSTSPATSRPTSSRCCARAPRSTARAAIRPGHIAVLVRTNRNAARVRDALEAVDVPAVINGAGSVFGTEPAREWLRLLEAIERPSYPPRARSAALTTFLGWTTEQVAAADDDDWEGVHRRLHHWARVLRVKGVASLMEAITLEEGLPGARARDGRRRAADDRPAARRRAPARRGDDRADGRDRADGVAARARARGDDRQQRRGAQPPAGERRRGGAGADHAPQQGARVPGRLLPGPVGAVVDPARERQARHLPRRRRDADDRRRARGPAVEGPRRAARRRAARRGPAARLRRADAREAPGGRVVGGLLRQPQLGAVAAAVRARRRRERRRRRARRCRPTTPRRRGSASCGDAAPGCVSVGAVGARARPCRGPATCPRPRQLSASSFDRDLDWWWRRTSFSDITAGTYEARVASEPEEAVVDDESVAARAAGARTTAPTSCERCRRCSPRCRSGVEVGTLVHRVFESTDFAAADLDLGAGCRRSRPHRRGGGSSSATSARVVAGLRAAIETPLGPRGGVALRDVARADRLDELDFELPLVGGDDPSGPALTLSAIAGVLRAHAAPGDPLAGYAERLLDPRLRASVRGYLAGSIDLVAATRRRALRGRRLQDQLARAARRGADRLAPPPGRAAAPR